MGEEKSMHQYVNWPDVVFQLGWLIFLCAAGFAIYKILKIRKMKTQHLKK
ncbi:hypothetical protein BF29_1496 [Heyndrickxia coagulans DSM 1 = ATCC 7050]|uniref:Uncharacterized protein n=1 Tax=Heyndrickxia coagulans DSM 1 = ATCC 7050 TaxID=1121088 RepID=A0A8B4BTW0_HEYCO|nr:hypothetical protein BF29_1496 [Heyndrickxia coagulans DSM 1 = ATCC 7050]SHE66844.1 hypothetical protein SAMN02745208_00694 [Heyndrickxia coagulans DSM 1 = ATCC 7050]